MQQQGRANKKKGSSIFSPGFVVPVRQPGLKGGYKPGGKRVSPPVKRVHTYLYNYLREVRLEYLDIECYYHIYLVIDRYVVYYSKIITRKCDHLCQRLELDIK